MMNFWVVKARLHKEDESEGWHWENYFDDGFEAGKEWGGEDWIRSNESKKYIREKVRKGDLVVCFQSDNADILGLTKMTTGGREEIRGSGEYNLLNFSSPSKAFRLTLPLKLQRLRENGCNPKCFEPGRQGTVFPLELKEFQGILSTIVKNFPAKKGDLARWLKSVGYSLREKAKGRGGETRISKGKGRRYGDLDKNKEVEKSAIKYVKSLLKRDGWQINSVEANKCGYDLLCTKRNEEINVEVKGVSGNEVSFIITAGEVAQAQTNEKFRLYCVTRALTTNPKHYVWAGKEISQEFDIIPIQFNAKLMKKIRGQASTFNKINGK